ncbi:MAG: hypothetical protein COB36_10730 [Alphaproteobacteria bacterium]|nr:MAG: hypothetical protein COB36_10730 [Alphaproteobacteria bacterium]
MSKDVKIWLVPHPTYQYNENIQELAKKHKLTVIDARHKASINPSLVVDGPKLTIKGSKPQKKPVKRQAVKATQPDE